MNKYFLVKFIGDGYFHKVMTQEELEQTRETITNIFPEIIQLEGTTIHINELLIGLKEAQEITEEQYKVLVDLNIAEINFGELNWDFLIEYFKEKYEDWMLNAKNQFKKKWLLDDCKW